MASVSDRPVDWEALIRANENRLYRAALAILGNAAEAEDAVQDAFLKYLEHPPRLDRAASAAPWLMRVTVNLCRDRLRAASRRNVPIPEDLPAPAPEERDGLEELLSLPAEDRALIHLYYYEGFSTAEIAAAMGMREGTVRSRLSRARSKLRVLLEKEES